MPFVATVEVLVNVLEFKNIDLPEQGLYSVACTVRAETPAGGDGGGAGASGRLLQNSRDGRQAVWPQERKLWWPRAFIDPIKSTGGTATIAVNYQDQVEVMDEAVLFRVDLPAAAACRPFADSIVVAFELHHMAQGDYERAASDGRSIKRDSLRHVSTREVPIRNTALAHTEWVPVTWPNWWAGCLTALVHTAAVDFRWVGAQRPASPQGSPFAGFADTLRKERGSAREHPRDTAKRLFKCYASHLAYTHAVCTAQKQVDEKGIRAEAGALQAAWSRCTDAESEHHVDPVPADPVAAPAAAAGLAKLRVVADSPPAAAAAGPAKLRLDVDGPPAEVSVFDAAAVQGCLTAPDRVETLLSVVSPAPAVEARPTDACDLISDRRLQQMRGRPLATWLSLCLLPVDAAAESDDRSDEDTRDACEAACRVARTAADGLSKKLCGALEGDTPDAGWARPFCEYLALAAAEAGRAWLALVEGPLLSDATAVGRRARARWWRDEAARARLTICEAFHDRPPVRRTDYSPPPSPSNSPRSTALPRGRSDPQMSPTGSDLRPPPHMPLTFSYPDCTYCEFQHLSSEAADAQRDAACDDDGGGGSTSTRHLVVMVHGYGGSRWDLAALRNHFTLATPGRGTHFYCATSVEKRHDESIMRLGKVLAEEVCEAAAEHAGKLQRLSFVGHSMGNLVIRAALLEPALAPFREKLHTFASLSGPHFGVADTGSTRVSGGMWVLTKLRKSVSMQELNLDDRALLRLAEEDTFGCFRHVVLLSSEDDCYVSMQSAVLDPATSSLIEQRGGRAKAAMVDQMVHHTSRQLRSGPARRGSVLRFNLRFKPLGRTRLSSVQDAAVGKAVHVAFLSNVDFVHNFVCLFRPYFV